MPARTRPLSGASLATLILVILGGVTCGEPLGPDARPRPREVPLLPSFALAGATANDLGTLGGASSTPSALNDAGTIVGYSLTSAGQTHAFKWNPGGSITDLGGLGGTTSKAWGINTAGDIVGSATLNNGSLRATKWAAGGAATNLGTVGANDDEAIAINDAGVVTGWVNNKGAHHVFRLSGTTITDLGTLGGVSSDPVGINASGVIAGNSLNASAQEHAFRWVTGALQDLGTLGGTTSHARSINSQGNIVGYSTTAGGATHAFRWVASTGTMTDLGTLGGTSSQAYMNNDSSVVVGDAQTATGATHAFRWTPTGGMQDLGTLTGGTNSTAYAVNLAGVVAGISDSPTGRRVFVWTAAGGMQDVGAAAGVTPQEIKAININKIVLSRGLSGTNDRAIRWAVTTNAPPVARIGGPYSGTEGVAISLSAAASTDPDSDPLTFEWDFENDGVPDLTTSSATTTHAYPDQGSFTLKVTAIDDDGARNSATTTVTVANDIPAVTVPASATATINEVYTLSGTAVDRGPNDGPWSVVFDWGDGTTSSSSAASLASALSATHTYTALGPKAVKLTVTDKDGASGTGQVALTVQSHPPLASAGGPYTGQEGSAVSFNASASSDPDGDALTYAWNFGDGTTGTGATPAHTYADNGSYTATVTVTDATGMSSTATATATITNLPPVVNAGPDAPADDWQPFTLSGSFTDAGANDATWSYTINWGDGSANTTGTKTAQGAITASHQYAAGIFTATLQVVDKDGGTSSDAAVITVANTTPSANAGGPYTSVEGSAVAFDGSASSSPIGSALTYVWNFGDGTTGTGVSPTHIYADNGTYTVTLSVTDAQSRTNSKSTTATISNVAPVVNAGPDVSGFEGLSVSLNGTFSDAGTADSPWSYTIVWGDGSANSTGTRTSQGAFTVTHVYATPGSYTATFTVTDKDNASTSDAAIFTVAAARPVASAGGPYTGNEGSPVSFNGSGSSDPNGDALTYAWNFGDGTAGTGATPTHAYADNGTYTVTLTVTDVTGLTSAASSATATIANVAPVVNAGADATVDEGATFTLGGSFSDAGTADNPWTYTVVWGDGTANTTGSATSQGAIAPTHVYNTPGIYTATLSVKDKDIATTSDDVIITVRAVKPIANAGGPYTGNEGSPVSFNGTGSSDPNGDALTYAWNFGDGSTGTGATPTHAYVQNGTYTVTLTVNDGNGHTSAPATATATISNVAPVANAGPDVTVDAGATFTLGGSFSDAGTADNPWTYTVVWGDGTANTTGSANAQGSVAPTHVYNTPGTFTATLTVTDKDNASGTDDVIVTVRAVTPVANAGGPYTGAEGSPVSFNGSLSSDPNGDPLTYSWNFGDGTTGIGVTPTHAYVNNGTYTVTLTVDDGNGHTGTATTTATISNAAPVVNAGANATIDEGQSFSLSGSFSDAGTADNPWAYTVVWGDASANATGSLTTQGAVTASHLYNTPGTYTVTLSVTDKDNATGTSSLTLTVRAVKPTANTGGPYTGAEGSPVSFNGSLSSDPNGDPLTYGWNFGDGSTGTGATPTHAYVQNGTYTVTLTVDDGNGHTGTATTTATISNVAPSVSAGANATIDEGQTFTLNGSFSDPGTADSPWSTTINWGDASAATTGSTTTQGAVSGSHLYNTAGIYTVTLSVKDKDNGTGSGTLTLTVRAVKPVANAGGPYTAAEGSAVSFNGSGSTDPNGDVLTYAWSFGDGTTGTGPTPSHAYVDQGSFTVTLTVDDGNGHTSTATTTATISNALPVVSMGAGGPIDQGQTFTLNGSFSDAGVNDTPWSYTLDWGDGSIAATGTSATQGAISGAHTYPNPGTYTITLSVKDKDNGIGTGTLSLVVRSVFPTANPGGPYTGNEGQPIAFDGSGSTDPQGDPLTYDWDFDGDGITDALTAKASFTYPNNGTYTARLTVTDPAGHANTATVTVTVLATVAGVSAGADTTIVTGGTYTMHGSFSDGPTDGPWSIEIRWGDGSNTLTSSSTTPTSFAISHPYAALGTYTATLIVTDKDGGTASDDAIVTVAGNMPPVANANGPYTADEGTQIQFSSAGSSDPNNETLTYSWAFGDGTTSTLANPKRAYADNGSYTVTLTVKDPSGATATSVTTATIANVAPTSTFTTTTGVTEGVDYTLTMSGTDVASADRATLEYAFDCGQGAGWTAFGSVKTMTCPALADQPAAALTVEGQVRDKDGGVSTYTKSLPINNALPVVSFAATTPTAIDPGGSVDISGSFTDKGAVDGPWTYTITWGDGSATTTGTVVDQTTPITATHVYTAPGTWLASMTVKDKDGGIGTSAKVTVTVSNDPPVANANGPYTGTEGTLIQFSSAGSADPNGSTLTYSWAFGDGTTSTLANPKHAYTDNGDYAVTLTVKDPSGAAATSTATASVANVAPTASFTAPVSTPEGTDYALTLAGTDVSSVDRATLEYAFDCGQGAGWTLWSATKSVTCPALPDQGATLTVQGQVRDKDGGVTPYSKTMSITNAAPVSTLSATTPTTIPPGQTVGVQGSFTDKGAGDGPWAYSITWGDGSANTTGTATDQTTLITASHLYSAPGTWSVTLAVTDKDGATGTSAKVTVSVSNTPPVANANGPYSGNEGTAIQFSSAGSADPDGSALTYSWAFGDGTSSAVANPTHAYADNGTYTVTLTVKDPSGAAGTSTATATVANVAPTATVSTANTVEGTDYTITLNGTDAGSADRATLEYAFDCGQGAGWTLWSTTKSTTCPALPDQQTVTIQGQVRDKDGASSAYTKAVSITNAPPVATLTATSPTSFQAGGSLSVQATFTDKGANDGPFTYTINWGDLTPATTGSVPDATTPITASHAYAKSGTFSAVITVKDKDGGAGASNRIAVTVSP